MTEAIKQAGAVLRDKLRNYLLDYQWDWLTDDSRYKVAEKARRTGWTYIESLSAVLDRLRTKRDYWFSSADETASLEFIEYCRFWSDFLGQAYRIVADQEIFDRQNNVTLHRLTFPNGSRITALSSNPTAFRSKGGDACWDEAAYHDNPKAMWAAIKPTIMWGGKIRIFSTHNGEGNYFNDLVKEGRAVSEGRLHPEKDNVLPWSFYSVTIEDAVEAGLVEKILGLSQRDDEARTKWLAEERAGARDQATWDQEYMCRPSRESTTLLPFSLIAECSMPADELLGRFGGGKLYSGFDIGREQDLTVHACGEAVGRVLFTRHLESLAKTRYRVQEKTVADFWRSHKITRFCGDATGIGDMLVESLQDTFGRRRVEKVKFTQESKEDLATGLLQKFEDHEIWVPDTREVREGLHKIRKSVTTSGNVRYGHADEFWAFALMVHAFAAGRKILSAGSRRKKPKGW